MTREDREAIIRRLEVMYREAEDNDNETKEALFYAIEALKEKPQWVPCSERLPEEDEEYLIEWDAGWGAEIRIVDYSQGGKYWYSDATGYEYRGVIAWMPLPTTYENASEA